MPAVNVDVVAATPAPAPAPDDAATLRAASALTVVTLSAYGSLRDVPAGGGVTSVPAVRDHLLAGITTLEVSRDALAEATRQAGGDEQTAGDPRYASLVEQVLPTVRGPGDVVGLALTLDDVLAQTLVRATIDLSTPALRRVAAGPATAAAARKARLLLLQSLLAAGGAELATTPPDLEALPAPTGAVGFPDVRFPTSGAAGVVGGTGPAEGTGR